MAATSFAAVIAAMKTLLETIPSIGTVDDRPGGVATWVSDPGAARSYWSLDVAQEQESVAGIGGTSPGTGSARREITVRIEGWMPFSYAGDTASAWRTRLDAVLEKLRENATLGGLSARIGMPRVTRNDYARRSSLHRRDLGVLCHRAVIEVEVEEFFEFTTA